MGNEQMQYVTEELQQTLIILSQIETMQDDKPWHEQAGIQSDKLCVRLEKNLAEIREKLARLIGPQ